MNKFDPKNQSGFTISSLMIGIAVALVCILASLQLYAAHRISTAQMKVSSIHSRQLSSTIVVVEKQIMAAGYGIAVRMQMMLSYKTLPAPRPPVLQRVSIGAILTEE